MRTLILSLFLLIGAATAKDNFIYHADPEKQKKQIEKIQHELAELRKQHEALKPYAKLAQTNQVGVEQNAKKLASLKYKNRSSDKKISAISDSLNAINETLKERKPAPAPAPVVKTEPAEKEVVVMDTLPPEAVTRDELSRIMAEIDNLMDRTAVLEGQLKTLKQSRPAPQKVQGGSDPMDEVRTALYEYFEYYVIVTVILFFLMFIIIFSLVSKTRHLQAVTNELIERG